MFRIAGDSSLGHEVKKALKTLELGGGQTGSP